MGLDCSHGAWHGAYSAFHRWRAKLAEVVGIPLDLMEGFYDSVLPSERVLNKAMEWAAPREGGPLCQDSNGIMLHMYIENVRMWLPIKWSILKDDPILVLLDHSDCDGIIESKDCLPLAERLSEILPLLPDGDGGGHIGDWREKTQTFIDGLRLAASLDEDIEFG